MKIESSAGARKDSTPPVDGPKTHVDATVYSQEIHDSAAASIIQSKEETGTDQVAASFGDMNISVAVGFHTFDAIASVLIVTFFQIQANQ